MLSKCSIIRQCTYRWGLTKYSTAAHAAIEQPQLENSYVTSLQHEWQQAKPFKSVPGLTKFQMIRSFMRGGEFQEKPFNDVLNICRQRYGDIFLMPGVFGLNSNLMTFNLTDYEKIFRTEGPYPVRPGLDVLMHYRLTSKHKFYNEEYLGVAGNGKQWGKFRHAVNPVLMQPKNTVLYIDPMQKVNSEFVQRIRDVRDPSTLEVPDTFMSDIHRLAFETLVMLALDKEMGLIRSPTLSPESKDLFDHLLTINNLFLYLGVKPSLYKYVKTPTYRRFEKSMDKVFEYCFRYVNEALQRFEANGGVEEGKSVLEKLIQIDRKIAIIMAIDLLMGGVEVTSTAMSGLLLCLATNPEKQEILRHEILSKIGKTQQFTMDNMKQLPYLRACIKEALRMYPVVFGNVRTTGMDLCLSGYQIPKSTSVFLASNMLLSEERYFPKPKEFMPERWLRSNGNEIDEFSAKNISPFIFLPFGLGPRSCVGKRIVDLELEITLANIVRNFRMEYNYPTDNAFRNNFLNYCAIPLKFKFVDLN